ncbi:hypothetical protein [Dyadobacter jiangsuensis]|nr:hypothetical protein [Dyadobacter jiangsuensis]
MRKIFTLAIMFAGLMACEKDSAEEKMVNAEFSKIQANWSFSSFKLAGKASDTLKFNFNSGSFRWASCKYTDEGKYSQLCGGDITLNGLDGYLTYLYDVDRKQYQLGLLEGDNTKDKMQYSLYRKILTGKWTIEVVGDVLNATQIENDSIPDLKASFVANKK